MIHEKLTVLTKAIFEHKGFLSKKIGKINDKKVLQSEISNAKTVLARVDNYLITNSNDALLLTELTGIKEKLKYLQEAKTNSLSLRTQLISAQKLRDNAEEHLKIERELFQKLEKKNIEVQEKVAHLQQSLLNLLCDRQLREYRADLAHLNKEMIYLRKIVDLESERKQLEDNQPCPLCGALLHPFAKGNIPEQDEIQRKINELNVLIDQADQIEAAQKVLEANEKRVAFELSTADKLLQQAQNNKDACQLAINNKLSEQTIANENFNSLLNAISLILQPFGFTEIVSIEPDEIFSQLNKRVLNWQEQQQKKSKVEEQISGLAVGIEQLNLLIKTLGGSLKAKLSEIIGYRIELDRLKNQRTELYGQNDPDIEELRLTTILTTIEKSEREASDQKNKLSQVLNGLKNRIIELKTTTSFRKGELDSEEGTFLMTLQSVGFDDETTFMGCRLSRERRDELSRQATSLDLKQADILTRKKDREGSLSTETAKNMSETPLTELTEQQKTTSLSLNFIREEIGSIRQKLADNLSAKERFGEMTLRIEAQKSECKRWDMLYNLIGSADGKKYRNFAQGLTFEIMVAHANRQLIKLTDRYLLIRDKEQPLDLNVIDNYQAGEVRSTKNLSGGESFIVSLALALGLSKMASKKVRVDSLFLDEGFGSLDEDTLETALETLASLRQDGKLIGVISHVVALKDRIPAKIMVQKVSGGKSVISGPGCSRN